MSDVRHLTRLRWGVRAVLALGVAASVCANILHAQPNPISQAIAAWPPIALLLTVELISRVPIHRRALAAARLVATAAIAGIAAWVSYHHMAAVAARYGETGASAYLLPLSVDGLIVVGSVCLVELGGRLAAATAPTAPDTATPADTRPRDDARVAAPAGQHDAGQHDVAARAQIASATPSLTAQAGATAAGPGASPQPAPAAAYQPTNEAAAATPAGEPPAGQPDADAGAPAAVIAPPAAAARQPAATPARTDGPPTPAPLYQPTSDEDAAMYQAWRDGVAAGREPTGADLARAAGRRNDASSAGRRAARRYRAAHAQAMQRPQEAPHAAKRPPAVGGPGVAEGAATTAVSPVPAVAAAPPTPGQAHDATPVRHNGHRPTLTGGAA